MSEVGQEMIKPADAITAVDKMTAEEYGAWLTSEGINVVEFKGSDWDLVGDKDTLLAVPFVIARIRFNEGDSGNFVSVCCYTKTGKVIFNDGSTGVYEQLKDYTNKNARTTAISCPRGLRVSRYTYTDDKGVDRDAATYYLG